MEKVVRWTEKKDHFGTMMTDTPKLESENNGVMKIRKRYAVRDQPTWQNCKQFRVIHRNARKDKQKVEMSATNTSDRIPSEIQPRMNSPRHSLITRTTLASPVSLSQRESRCSGELSNNMSEQSLGDVVRRGSSTYSTLSTKGREILRRKAKEELVLSATSKFRIFQPQECIGCQSQTGKKSFSADSRGTLQIFRVPSAACIHRSPDVSIGLRHISRLIKCLGDNKHKTTKALSDGRRKSESVILSHTEITTTNIEQSRRRQSVPIIIKAIESQNASTRSLAPGEGYLISRRTSSLSAPATRGSESSSLPSGQKTPKRSTRKLPAVQNSMFAHREWRPSALEKYSTEEPWAPKQQTPRYFPKHSNLQDIHCRNPYVVPGSVLYKTYPVYM